MSHLVAWLLATMLSVAPPGRSTIVDAVETPEAGKARYEQIAEALATVALDPHEASIFAGKEGREHTAAVLLSILLHESGLRRDVDLGIGPHARGDGGRSVCGAQIMVAGGTTREGWDASALEGDRTKCYRVALRLARASFAACRALPLRDRLASYGAGICEKTAGRVGSRAVMDPAERWWGTWRAE